MEQERKAGQEAGEYVTAGGLVNGGAELVEFTLVGRPFVGLADGHQNVSKQRVYGRGKWIVEVLCAKISTHGKAPWGPYFVSLSCGGWARNRPSVGVVANWRSTFLRNVKCYIFLFFQLCVQATC